MSSKKKFIEQELAKLKESVIQKFNVPKNVEFHGHCMFQFKGDWKCMNGLYTQSTGIYRSAMRILAKSYAKVIIRGVAADELNNDIKNVLIHLMMLRFNIVLNELILLLNHIKLI